jgi:signal transduction histidine kinase
VDVDLIKQAVLNVVQNGAQAMPQGGKLEVVSLLEEGKSAVIQIKDEGMGISEELRERYSICTSRPKKMEAASDWP